MLVSTPVMFSGRFLGMIGSVVDLQFLIRRLQEVNRGGLTPYVVDSQGRLVAGATSDYATGQDMSNLEIVRNFVEAGTKVQMVAATREFNLRDGKSDVGMLGTYSPCPTWIGPWSCRSRAMRPTAASLKCSVPRATWPFWPSLSVSVSVFSPRTESPIPWKRSVAPSSRAIARGDFSTGCT